MTSGITRLAVALGLPDEMDYTTERAALIEAVQDLRTALAGLDGADCKLLRVANPYELYMAAGSFLNKSEAVSE